MEKVSIIMNSYNENPKWLNEAIDSCLYQQGVDVELIISTVKGDNAAVEAKKRNIICIENEIPGIYPQLNSALSEISGQWYTYSSSNDVMLLTKLKDEIELCIKNSKKICYSAYYECDQDLKIKRTVNLKDYDYSQHLKGNFVSDLSVVKIDILEKYKPFKELYKMQAYYDFWLRIAEVEGKDIFIYNPKPEWKYRVNNDSIHIKRAKDKDRIKKYISEQRSMVNDHINHIVR